MPGALGIAGAGPDGSASREPGTGGPEAGGGACPAVPSLDPAALPVPPVPLPAPLGAEKPPRNLSPPHPGVPFFPSPGSHLECPAPVRLRAWGAEEGSELLQCIFLSKGEPRTPPHPPPQPGCLSPLAHHGAGGPYYDRSLLSE